MTDTNKLKHTPTPWRLDERGESVISANNSKVGIYGLPFYWSITKDEERTANADFILTAVNHHAKLIEALKKVCSIEVDSWNQWENEHQGALIKPELHEELQTLLNEIEGK